MKHVLPRWLFPVAVLLLIRTADAEPPTETPSTPATVPAPAPVPAVVASPAKPPASDEQPARRYARGSTTVLGGATLTTAFIGDSQAGTSFQAVALSGSVAVRKVTRFGLTFEPRLGVDAFLATSTSGIYAVLAPRVGLGVGWAFALGRNVATTPKLSYDLLYLAGGVSSNLAGFMHIVAVELPLAVFLGRNAFVEVFLDAGAVQAFGQVAPMITAGYRFGVVL